MNSNQKGTALDGATLTDEVLASTESIFQKNGIFGGQKGLQQFFSPRQLSSLAYRVMGSQVNVLDPTAGDGSLLRDFDPPHSFGIEIDPEQIERAEGGYQALEGDLQHYGVLLRHGGPKWSAIVANPPFGLRWSDPYYRDGREVYSDELTFWYITELLADDGQFLFVDLASNFEKRIATKWADWLYAVITVPGLFAPDSDRECVVAFGIHPDLRSASFPAFESRTVTLDMLDLAGDWVCQTRTKAINHYNSVRTRDWIYSHEMTRTLDAIKTEYKRRVEGRVKANREYDMLLVGGNTIQFLPSGYATLALRKLDDYAQFSQLNKAKIGYFANQERLWNKCIALASSGALTIEPKLISEVEKMLGDYKRSLRPLYEIKPQQRLGFLSEYDTIRCSQDDEERGFEKGQEYPLRTDVKPIQTTEKRIVESKKKPGEFKEITVLIQRPAMHVRVGSFKFNDGDEAAQENIQWFIDHFEIPHVPSVQEAHPEEIAQIEAECQIILDRYLEASREYEKKHPSLTPYTHRPFQKRDVARLCFKNRGLLSWEQGLGKTLAAILFSDWAIDYGKAQDAVLIVTSKDLVPQWQREIERFTGRTVEVIKSHGQAHAIAQKLKRGGTGWYITYYEALSIVGTKGKQKVLPPVTVREWEEDKLVAFTDRWTYFIYEDDDPTGENPDLAKVNEAGERRKQIPCPDRKDPDGLKRKMHYGYVYPQFKKVTKKLTSKDICPECGADKRNGWNGVYCENEKPDGSKCGYAHYAVRIKPMASLLSTAFKKGIIAMDEITLIQGDYSLRSKALRGLRAKYRIGMTGTPIKNFVGQLFWLLWWALYNSHQTDRFPYDHDGGKVKFETDYSVIEWTMSAGKKESKKVLPEVANLSLLWRQLCSCIIRRRKEETGEDIVPKFYHDIHVPLGMAQAEQMKVWLKDFPEFFAEKYPDAPVVKSGMHTVMAPMLGLNWKLDYTCTLPQGDPDTEWTGVEGVSDFTPANMRVIELAMALAKDGRKVLVGSNLIKTSQWVAERLNEKGVKAVHILDEDGTTANPDARAKRVYSFQTDDVQVFCAGVNAIRLGHNLDAANAVILHGLDWSYDTMDQFVARAHRLTSKEPVDVYCILPSLDDQNTITTRKWDILNRKGAASDLALDGRLVPKHEERIEQADIIRELMERGITVTDQAVDEISVQETWDATPHIDDYTVPVGIIPTRPEIEPENDPWLEVAEIVGQFFVRFATSNPVSSSADLEGYAVEIVTVDESYEHEDGYWDDEAEANLITVPERPTEEEYADLPIFELGAATEPEATASADDSPASEGIEEASPVVTHDDGAGRAEEAPMADVVTAPETPALSEAARQEEPGEIEPDGTADPTTSAPAPPTTLDPMDQLRKAKELHDLGILDDDEFAATKKAMLAILGVAA